MALALCCLAGPGRAEQIYRCGNEYTNIAVRLAERGCTPVQGGSLTVVDPPRAAASPANPSRPATARPAAGTTVAASPPVSRVDPNAQRTRDQESRAILDTELRRAEARLAELQRDYAGGQPDKRGDEVRNHQRYLDRVAAMKADIDRQTSDIAGIRRELARLPGGR